MTYLGDRDRRICGICKLRHKDKCVATDQRWPVDPLVAFCGSTAEVCRRLGWEHKGLPVDLSDTQADRYATRLGLHPEVLWPGWTEHGLSAVDRARLDGGWRPAWLWSAA